jgi:hypothetical protein
MTEEAARRLIGDDVPEKPVTLTARGIYIDAETSEPIFAYLPMPSMVAELRAAVLQLRMTTTPRATGVTNVSRTFGMAPRKPVMRREACTAATMASDQPDSHRVLVDLAQVFSGMMRSLLPHETLRDEEWVAKILPEWRMTDDALWTSGVVNRSSTLPYHLDRANFPTWSAMPVVRRHMRGGYLDVPEYGIVCACRDGWCVFFIGQKLVHGVTPMWPVSRDAYRYSVVYYALRGMKDCFTTAVEQRRARQTRTDREQGMGLPDDSIAAHEEAG